MSKKQRVMLWRIFIATVLLIGLQFVPVEGTGRLALFLIPYFIIGYDILKKAWQGICRKNAFNENFLMAIATIGAIFLAEYTQSGDYNEAVAVMLFYQIGEFFQGYAVGKSRRNITALMDIRPDYANITVNGRLEKISPEEVEVGTIISILPGERVPLDGIILKGASSLDTKALTGESMPRKVSVNDEIYSGCINLNGLLEVRVTKEFYDSTAVKIMDLVEEAASRKAKSEEFISTFARRYTPIVCYSALALATVPPLFSYLIWGVSDDWQIWLYRALIFLVISCPCAVVISVPLTFFAAIGGASKAGILIKGACFMEALAKVKNIIFDKTGTLTEGSFAIKEIHGEGYTEEEVLEYVAYGEVASNHPLALAIRKAYGRDIDKNSVENIEELSGKGIRAVVAGKKIAVGNHSLMTEVNIAYKEYTGVGSVIYLAIEGKYAGYVVLADVVKENAFNALRGLEKIGIERTVMLTGDNSNIAQEIGNKLGITEVYSQLLPQDKVFHIEKLMEEAKEGKTAFVGDGINDAPVLSRADLGIAMGGIGSDAAIEAADVVLMDDDLQKLPKAILLAQKCMNIVYQNIAFALIIKFACLALGAVGIANMWMAIFADVGVMILAILNAIRAMGTIKL